MLQKDWTAGDGMLGGMRRGISGEGAAIMYVPLSLLLSVVFSLIRDLVTVEIVVDARTSR